MRFHLQLLIPSLLAFAASVEKAMANEMKPDSKSSIQVANKIFARTSGGIISNVGTVRGSAPSFGGATVGLAIFLNDQIAVGGSYKIETNFSSVPLKGFDILARYYPLGTGSVVEVQDASGNRSERHRNWNYYLGAEYSNRDFYLVGDANATTAEKRAVNGTLSSINLATGVDYRLSRHWELTGELNVTLLAFSGSDPRVKVRWILAGFGVNYVF